MDIKNLQEEVAIFIKGNNMQTATEYRVLDLVSEVGELSKEVLKGSNYGINKFDITKNWTSEIGDVLFSLICVANQTGVQLEEALMEVLNKYKKRISERGHSGSGR